MHNPNLGGENPNQDNPYQNVPNPNVPPNYPEQNYPGQGTAASGQPGQNYPYQNVPSQNVPPNYPEPNVPGRHYPYQNVPGQQAGYQNAPTTTGHAAQQPSVPSGTPFTQEEWQELVATPLRVSIAMMAVSPSGPVGVVQEALSIGKSLQALQQQGTMDPLLAELSQQITQTLQNARTGNSNLLGDVQANINNPQAARTSALASTQQACNILRKASPQDAASYKQLVYTFAQNVAQAAREGGFFGFGGQQISQPEQALLQDLTKVLGIRPS